MEKGGQNLHRLLRNEIPTIEQRRLLAIDLRKGLQYLFEIGLEHNDQKLENIVLFGETPKWIDFGVMRDDTGNESYRRMGYVRRGSKFRNVLALASGTPGFCCTSQIIGGLWGKKRDDAYVRRLGKRLYYFLFCDWKTAWTLLFKPISEEEKAEITQLLESINAPWLTTERELYNWNASDDDFEAVTAIASYKKANNWFILDENLTKSLQMSQLNRKLRRGPSISFQNFTRHPLDQGDSNLCVPVNLTTMLRHAIKEHCSKDHPEIKVLGSAFTSEKILYFLTMRIYPRSLAGLNLNPDEEEIEYQGFRRFEDLLERMVKPTYNDATETGWEWMRRFIVREFYNNDFNFLRSSIFSYEKVIIDENFDFQRPIAVTCHRRIGRKVDHHEMVVDRVENGDYVLQNTATADKSDWINHWNASDDDFETVTAFASYKKKSELRIGMNKIPHVDWDEYMTYPPKTDKVVTDEYGMNEGEWYLSRTAFSVQIKLP